MEDLNAEERTGEVKEKKRKKKGLIVAIVVIVILVAAGGIGLPLYFKYTRPDAKVSLSTLKPDVKFYGVDGSGKVDLKVIGEPLISDVKIKERAYFASIQKTVRENLEITADKSENLKNGEEIMVTIKLKKIDGLKIKCDKEALITKHKVEGLVQLVKEFKDIPNDMLEMAKTESKKRIIDSLYKVPRNFNAKELGILQLKLKDNEVQEYTENIKTNRVLFPPSARVVLLFEIEYEVKKMFSDEYEENKYIYAITVGDFVKQKSKFNIINRDRFEKDTALEDIINTFKHRGYEEVK